MIITKEIIINSSIEKVWQILGTEFSMADKWASVINHSEGTGSEFNGATCSERGCSTTMGDLKEKLLHFSNESHSLSYHVYYGMPSMVKRMVNSWSLEPVSDNKIKLTMKMNMQTGGIMGAIMKPMMKMNMTKMGNQTVEELKHYVENGKPHPRKIKALSKK